MKKPLLPSVSVVLAMRNEARTIKRRLENLAVQDYPAGKMEIIAVSDGSDDNTEALVKEMQDSRIQLLTLPTPHGKAVALAHGVAVAKGEIIVFADARQTFETSAIRELMENFGDPTVGCVSGQLVFVEKEESAVRVPMGAYWSYEKSVRRHESLTGSTIGVSGSIYAMRRELYRPLPAGTLLDDVFSPMLVIRQGYRVVFEEKAVAFDVVSRNIEQEWRRKVRTLTGNWQLLGLAPWLAFPKFNPVWGRFMSHKIFRILVPFFLAAAFVSSGLLPGLFYTAAFIVQGAFYAIAASAAVIPRLRTLPGIGIIYFFVVLNAAAVIGFWKWISGQAATTWQRSADLTLRPQ
ncbi:MAG TPA: glycosyltransferase family 2 protein [Dissulfurispiraceae bacterium]|nr:glycosyltransferase family 2 protein [Dissulfurispiraceae bacterium]